MIKQIFNHLLLRIIHLASERLSLLMEIKSTMQKWVESNKQDKQVQRTISLVEDLFKNKDLVHGVIEALEESKPKSLIAEQEDLITMARKMFRWSMTEYKALIEYASEIDFNKQVLNDLQSESKLER